ncbi:integrin alpha N-terminal domain-containing protein [Cadophora sp. DSE1049]|nr:integrin alpha N-terminal domain-containing protein [Cadophora sp. DSE1049]
MKLISLSALWAASLAGSILTQPNLPSQSLLKPDLTPEAGSSPAVSQSICNGTVKWIPRGIVAAGVLDASEQLMFGDINGDGRDDYLAVDPQGAVRAWFNKPGESNGKILWEPQGVIATGASVPPSKMRFADITGNNLVDYLTVDDKPALVHMWENGGRRNSAGSYIWTARGVVARGGKNGGVDGAGVYFADIDGDGRADYIWLDTNGTAHIWINNGFNPAGTLVWVSKGVFTLAVGAKRDEIRLADIDGDGKADYLWVNPVSGATKMWRNGGEGANGKWNWEEKGTIASGVGNNKVIIFAKLGGHGRADYLSILPGKGAVEMWENECGSKSAIETNLELK